MNKSDVNYIKTRTLELYDSLPQELEARKAQLEIRDEIFDLNYPFLKYIASHKYINNPYITYEDKVQSACCAFLDEWWKFKYEAKYRSDLSFAVFFKLRLEERMERELNEVQYSLRRTLCKEVGDQLHKHWAQVKYDDLANVDLAPDKLESLKAIFGSMYQADIETQELFTPAVPTETSIVDEIVNMDDKYDTIEELLMIEMINNESKLSDQYLADMSDMYSLDYNLLKRKLPTAEKLLYQKIQDKIALSDQFSND